MKVISCNVRGLRDTNKCRQIFRYLHEKQADVIFLQETHATKNKEKQWKTEWGGRVITGRNEVVAKVMFLHVSVILSTGGVLQAGRPPWLGDHPPGTRQTPPAGRTPPVAGRPPPRPGRLPLGPGRPPQLGEPPPPPPGSRLQNTVYERLVCILLECILVFDNWSSDSRGIAIMFKRDCNVQIKQVIKSKIGRYIIMLVEFNEKQFLLVNTYAPNKDEPEFFLDIFAKIQPFRAEVKVSGGDMNITLNDKMDKFSKVHKPLPSKATQTVNEFIDKENWADIWRICHPEVKGYT